MGDSCGHVWLQALALLLMLAQFGTTATETSKPPSLIFSHQHVYTPQGAYEHMAKRLLVIAEFTEGLKGKVSI